MAKRRGILIDYAPEAGGKAEFCILYLSLAALTPELAHRLYYVSQAHCVTF